MKRLKVTPLLPLLLCVFVAVFNRVHAQSPTLVDPSFTSDGGADDDVFAIALQPDGKILIGGQFTYSGEAARSRVARLNENGSVDTTFDPGTGADGDFYAIALQSDGAILLGGAFTHFNGAAAPYLVRLDTHGAVDSSFTPETINNELRAIIVQPDQRILIAGRFTGIGSQARGRVARLNANGSLDPEFPTGSGANNNVRCMALQPDGKVLLGGTFTSCNGVARARVARLNSDGLLDDSFNRVREPAIRSGPSLSMRTAWFISPEIF